jgi:hypothetical protein
VKYAVELQRIYEKIQESSLPACKSETVEVYTYKKYKYHKLSDALKYAEIDALRDEPDPEALT